MLYFAYGANTNVENMKQRCPRAKRIGRAAIKNAALVFRGVADIIPAKGETVFGALWEITKKCEEALDRFEGFPNLYIKQTITVRRNGKPVNAMVYTMRKKREVSEPSLGYFTCIAQGYSDFGYGEKEMAQLYFKAYGRELEMQDSSEVA